MHWKDFDLNLLPALDALLRIGSVSGAADQLGLAQPAVSQMLKRLRLYFNDPLFVRSGHRMVATPKALELAPAVAQMMETARACLVPGAGFEPAQSERVFTLSMSDVAELVFLPRLLPQLRRLAPQVQLRIVRVLPRELAGALERRDVDLALGSTRLVHEGLFQQQLFRHPLACMAAHHHPLLRDGLTLAAYQACEHIGVLPPGTDEDIFEWALQQHGVQRRIVMTTPGFMALPMLIEHSQLVATVPQRLAEVSVVYGSVRAHALPVAVAPLALRQTWHARFHHDPANSWLRQQVFTVFQSAETTAAAATAGPTAPTPPDVA